MKRRTKIAIGVGIVFAATILIAVIHHYQLKAEVNRYIAQLKAQGEPLDLAQVIPPPVPPEQNDAPAFLKAASKLKTGEDLLWSNPPPGMRMVGPGKAMITWVQSDVRGSEGTNTWQDYQNVLDTKRDALNVILEITKRPQIDFNLNYTGGFDTIRLPDLASLKRTALTLSADAIVSLHRGDADSAIRDTHALLVLINATQHDHLIITELVRIAMAQIAIDMNWEILQSTNMTDGQLAELQEDWANFDFVQNEENCLETERAAGQIDLRRERESKYELNQHFDLEIRARKSLGLGNDEYTFANKVKLRSKVFLWRYWWSYTDELRALKGYEAILNTVRSIHKDGAFWGPLQTGGQEINGLGITNVDGDFFAAPWEINFHTMISESIASLSPATERVMQMEIAQNVMVAAIALKRYQLKTGRYPTELETLVPKFASQIPSDPVDGKPLRYRLNADGTFTLYSIGPNGKDDGGNLSRINNESQNLMWENNDALDWVWPQPASAEEVQKYYANLGKQN